MMYKCTTNCPILSDNCVAIRPRKWTCNAGLIPTWAPLCNSCAHAGVCDTNDTNVVECAYYKEEADNE